MFKSNITADEEKVWEDYINKYGCSNLEDDLEHALIRWESTQEDFPVGSCEAMECKIRRKIIRNLQEREENLWIQSVTQNQ